MTYTAFFGFCGSGGKAYGFQQAGVTLLDQRLSFRVVGGFDVSPIATRNFRYFTGVEALTADVREITPAMLRAAAGGVVPDVVCASPPCKGASKLITDAKAAEPHYEALNELALVWTRLMLDTWHPRLVLFENVPNITTRAPHVIEEVRRLLKDAGYVFNDGSHELGTMGPEGRFYDAGELGGLAQKRRRWLLVARDPKACSTLLYKPVKRRVRGVGEVIGALPLPGDPAGGPLHGLPRISTLNWIRLAMIPAGGDWRDLPGVLGEEQQRREVFRRMHLAKWEDPCVTIGGSGSNGPYAVADPRVKCSPWAGAYGVTGWEESSATITGTSKIDNRPVAVADPRVKRAFDRGYSVVPWDTAANTIACGTMPGQGAYSVADPRVLPQRRWFPGVLGVVPWEGVSSTVCGENSVANGRFAVADPRTETAPAGWLTVDDVMVMLETKGPWAVVDRGSDGAPLFVITDLAKPPPEPLRILARDGTWHRPFTPLELAALQGLPTTHRGEPLHLEGTLTEARESIGDLVPPPAAQSIAEQMLLTLGQHDLGAFALSDGGGVWVDPVAEAVRH